MPTASGWAMPPAASRSTPQRPASRSWHRSHPGTSRPRAAATRSPHPPPGGGGNWLGKFHGAAVDVCFPGSLCARIAPVFGVVVVAALFAAARGDDSLQRGRDRRAGGDLVVAQGGERASKVHVVLLVAEQSCHVRLILGVELCTDHGLAFVPTVRRGRAPNFRRGRAARRWCPGVVCRVFPAHPFFTISDSAGGSRGAAVDGDPPAVHPRVRLVGIGGNPAVSARERERRLGGKRRMRGGAKEEIGRA